jgi:uncharacterized protein (TIGR02231 family)
LYAQEHQKVNIQSATIFLKGAELTGTAKINFKQGENEILFTNIAGNVNQQSLTIGASQGIAVESFTYQNNYLVPDHLTAYAQLLKDSIDLLNNEKSNLSTELTVTNNEISVLQGNNDVRGANTGLSVAELQKLLDLINARMGKYLTAQRELQNKIATLDKRMQKLNLQLGQEQKKDYLPGGQLLVKFFCKQAVNTDVVISYVAPDAGWTPSYDLKVEKLTEPVHLFYKANVYQNCGVAWDNVKLTLSTGNPDEGVQAPQMYPWYLSFYEPPKYNENVEKLATHSVTNVAGYSNGVYNGSRADDNQIVVDGVAQAPATINEYVNVNNTGMNTRFDIDLPYTIPSDGQQHMVAIKTYDVPATYRYFAVPKLNENAYLQAQVTGWEDLDLLPGNTNIFYEGSYVGQGTLDMRTVKDTMNFSLGKDKKIIIKREVNKQLKSQKTIGTNIRQSYAYDISIRNTRKEPVNLVVLDQLPVSNNKDLAVENVDASDATINETTGEVKWQFDLKPGDTRKLKIGYTLKYPKGKMIAGL